MQMRILVVEDDPELLELVSFNLKQAGHAVSAAANGAAALDVAHALVPDVIVLDLMLPEMDGLAVCKILRRDPRTKSVPIVMLTALSSQMGRLAGLACGANEYLIKPCKMRHLVAEVEKWAQPSPTKARQAQENPVSQSFSS